ncbi:YdcH family protein [Novosphingobium sp.]|uniref:YdcH family protein n=1 Tax=Novosphingobium sp. TaxID=1874826 RepID=UPI0035B49503
MTDKAFYLMRRHQQLDEQLRLAMARLRPDPAEISRLKKLKLAIKDRLARFARPRLTRPVQG